MKQVSDSPNLVNACRERFPTKTKSAAEMPAPQEVADWARLAAYLDGEGCIGIYAAQKPLKSGGTRYSSVVTIAQGDPRLMEWLYDKFGGAVYLNGSKKRYRPIYSWTLPTDSMEYVLAQVRPYMVLKAAQVDVWSEFRSELNDSKLNPRVTALYEQLRLLKRSEYPMPHAA